MLNRLRVQLERMLQGRRGVDQLSSMLLVLAVFFNLSYVLTHNGFFIWVFWALCIVGVWRIFSKNIPMRQRENEIYQSLFGLTVGTLGRKAGDFKARQALKKQFHLFQCPHCGQKLRMPRGRGTVAVTCHKCKTTFQQKS